jgi:hypothetical protein
VIEVLVGVGVLVDVTGVFVGVLVDVIGVLVGVSVSVGLAGL